MSTRIMDEKNAMMRIHRLVGYRHKQSDQTACKACVSPAEGSPWVPIWTPWRDAEDDCCHCGKPLWCATAPNLFERLKAGETLQVRNPRNGKEFTLVPHRWHGIVLAYSFLVNGVVESGYDKIMLDDASVKDMCAGLEECK